jgi:hypothetical protein
MAFPATPLGAKLQIQLSGTWVDATRYDSRTKILQDPGITITRGKSDVQDKTPPSTATWTWDDPNGVYNNENPRSPYFGILPRNTPVRCYVPRATPALLMVDGANGIRCSTADKAALAIIGDIDVRIDIEPTRWRGFGSRNSHNMLLASKGVVGQRSWAFFLREDGTIAFQWAPTGVNSVTAISTVSVGVTTGRLAVRAFLDVDNGSSGRTVTFYTAPTITGTWTMLGTPVTTAGVTAIFASTGVVELGTINNGAAPTTALVNGHNYVGRIFGFQIYNSSAALVANANFDGQTSGISSFSDGTNTWAATSLAEITNADYRFYGELSAPVVSPEVSFNGVGVDVKVMGEAGGLIRRLSTNATPLQSPIYRNLNFYNPNLWITGEDSSSTAGGTASSAATGADPAQITDITFSGYDPTLAGSAGVMTLGGTGPLLVANARIVATTNETNFIGYFKFPSIPLSGQTLFSIYGNGTVKRWDFVVNATNYILNGYDSSGTQLISRSSAFGAGADPTNWIALHFELINSAGTITPKLEWLVISAAAGDIGYINGGTTTYAGDNGTFTKVVVQGVAALSGVKIAHLMTTNQLNLIFFTLGSNEPWGKFSRGYAGETADQRFARICTEQGITGILVGLSGNSEAMGPQPIDQVMNILQECQAVDGGQLREARDQLALEYLTRTSLINGSGLSISYTVGKHLSDNIKSTPDDTNVKNDVTINRKNGGSGRAVLTAGPMSTASPANGGIGTVPDEFTLNAYLDSRLPYLAQYALLLGTWPAARYPEVGIGLHRSPYLISSSLFLLAGNEAIGDPLTITDLPQFMPADPIQLMVQGTREVLGASTWDITYNTTPYGPWRSNETTGVTGEEQRADATADPVTAVIQTRLAASAAAGVTSLSVKTLSGPLLVTTATDPTQFPFDALISGERVSVTAVTGTTSPQTATVTRAVNGVSKSLPTNAPFTVYQAFYATL